MKFLVAPNYFKGSLSALEAATAIKQGILQSDKFHIVECVPIADGGDGTLDAIAANTECIPITKDVQGPLGRLVSAKWVLIEGNSDKIAFIETAQANGLSLLQPEEYSPLRTSTYGVGQLLADALDTGCNKIYVTLGGSSTNDAGVGLLSALGCLFYDRDGSPIIPTAGELDCIARVDSSHLDKRLRDTEIILGCDVDNPLCGANGASAIYGPQKGASLSDIEILDHNLSHFADIVSITTGRDMRDESGMGAAGGLSFSLASFCNARTLPGFEIIDKLAGLTHKVADADIIITTEGRFDYQSLSGKAPYRLAKLAREFNKPVIVIAGSIEKGIFLEGTNIRATFSLTDGPQTLEQSMEGAADLLSESARNIASLLAVGVRIGCNPMQYT